MFGEFQIFNEWLDEGGCECGCTHLLCNCVLAECPLNKSSAGGVNPTCQLNRMDTYSILEEFRTRKVFSLNYLMSHNSIQLTTRQTIIIQIH